MERLFTTVKPYYVIHLASYVGGLYKNMNQPVNMIDLKNSKMNLNIVEACNRFKVKN